MDKNKDNELRNIKRTNYPSKKGKPFLALWVRFKRKEKKIQPSFRGAKWGSEEKVLEGAKLFRDAMEAELEISRASPGIGGGESKSGILGVNSPVKHST